MLSHIPDLERDAQISYLERPYAFAPIGAALIICPNQNGVLFVKSGRTGTWGFPKGRVEFEDGVIENVRDATIREVGEEVGIQPEYLHEGRYLGSADDEKPRRLKKNFNLGKRIHIFQFYLKEGAPEPKIVNGNEIQEIRFVLSADQFRRLQPMTSRRQVIWHAALVAAEVDWIMYGW